MPKIRKQPKRSSKKIKIPSLRNPFLNKLPMLPPEIAENLKKMEFIVPRHIDDVINEPKEIPEINIDMMKQALLQQELKITGLKQYSCRKKTSVLTSEELDHDHGLDDHEKDISSNLLLECPVEVNSWEYILHQNESVDFFWSLSFLPFKYWFNHIFYANILLVGLSMLAMEI